MGEGCCPSVALCSRASVLSWRCGHSFFDPRISGLVGKSCAMGFSSAGSEISAQSNPAGSVRLKSPTLGKHLGPAIVQAATRPCTFRWSCGAFFPPARAARQCGIWSRARSRRTCSRVAGRWRGRTKDHRCLWYSTFDHLGAKSRLMHRFTSWTIFRALVSFCSISPRGNYHMPKPH